MGQWHRVWGGDIRFGMVALSSGWWQWVWDGGAVGARCHPMSPRWGQEKLSCNPRIENGTHAVVCEMGNPMKAGAQVGGAAPSRPPASPHVPPCPPTSPRVPAGLCGRGAECRWVGGRGRCHHFPAAAQEVTPSPLRPLSVPSPSPRPQSRAALTALSPQSERPHRHRGSDGPRGSARGDGAAGVRVGAAGLRRCGAAGRQAVTPRAPPARPCLPPRCCPRSGRGLRTAAGRTTTGCAWSTSTRYGAAGGGGWGGGRPRSAPSAARRRPAAAQ